MNQKHAIITLSTLSTLCGLAILARMVQIIEKEATYEVLFRPSDAPGVSDRRKVKISLSDRADSAAIVAIQSPDSASPNEPERALCDDPVTKTETGETQPESIAYEPRYFDSDGLLGIIREENAITGYAYSNGIYETPITHLNHMLYRANPLLVQKDEKMHWEPECMVIFRNPYNGLIESGVMTYEGTNKDAFSIQYIRGENFGLRGRVYKPEEVCDVVNISYESIIALPSRASCQWISKHTANVSAIHKQLEEDIKSIARELAEEREGRVVVHGSTRVQIAPLQKALKDCKKARPTQKLAREYFPKNMYSDVFDVIRLRVRLDHVEIIQPVIVLNDNKEARIENQITATLKCSTESVFTCNIPLSTTDEILKFANDKEVITLAYDGKYCTLSQHDWKTRLLVSGDDYLWMIRSPNELQTNGLYNWSPESTDQGEECAASVSAEFIQAEPVQTESGPEIIPAPEPAPMPANDAIACEICAQPATGQLDGHHLCDSCHQKALDYDDRLETRLKRLQDRADKAISEGRAEIDAAHKKADMIPFGQPILVGHHSEKRDRAFRKRIENGYRRGFEALERGQRLQKRAQQMEKQQSSEDPRMRYTPISSDDPTAIIKLREKIAALEADQERMKLYNVQTRKALKMPESERMAYLVKALDCKEKTAQNLLSPDFAGRYGIPDYALKNNNANIRRLRQRLADMESEAKTRVVMPDVVEEETPVEGLTIERSVSDNRLRLIFPGKPEPETRAFLKSCGFRWSPQNKAWQRQLNQSAEWAAQRVIAHLQGEK